MNYTTKEIELPLSTEKEYILVDKDRWLSGNKSNNYYNRGILTRYNPEQPFRFDDVDSYGDGVLGSYGCALRPSISEDLKCFHEVVWDTEEKEESVEWNNGDECTVGGVGEYTFIGKCNKNKSGHDCILMDGNFTPVLSYLHELRKPESESERKHRLRLEAAFKLYSMHQELRGFAVSSFEDFKNTIKRKEVWLAVVDYKIENDEK